MLKEEVREVDAAGLYLPQRYGLTYFVIGQDFQ